MSGMAGVAIDSIYDMRTLFDGIPLDQMSVSMTMNGAVLPVMALYIVAAKNRASRRRSCRHHSERHSERVHGAQHLHLSAAASMRIISDIFAYTSQNMPKFNSISISGYHMQEAGATADLELAYTLADGIEYARPAWPPACHRQLRAAPVVLLGHRHELLHGSRQDARRAHAVGKLMRRSSHPKNPKSLSLRTHSQTSGWSLTAQDVYNNVGRTCVEAMAATQGHTQSLHTNALDEALALPTDFSARIARNTQLFLQQEAAPPGSIPGAARYYVENADARPCRKGDGAHIRRSKSSAAWPKPSKPASRRCGSRKPPRAPRRASTAARRPSSASTSSSRNEQPNRHSEGRQHKVREQQLENSPPARRARSGKVDRKALNA
jgi:methylmalonyl-CoA mutase